MAETQDPVGALFREGKLMPAIEAANAAVRKNPADLGSRILLAELLLFTGNVERADVILDAAAQADPTALIAVAEFRQLLRAEIARRQYSREGRVPEFLGEPTEALRAALAAGVALRAGEAEEAMRHAAEAEAARPRASGVATQQEATVSFDDFRDVDDLLAGFFEVLTTTGKYYWIPTERVESVEFEAPRRPRDLVWRRASMVVSDGPDGVVYIPALYDSGKTDLDDELRLGRATEWVDEATGPVRGIGQRVFLIGDDAQSVMELATLRFRASVPVTAIAIAVPPATARVTRFVMLTGPIVRFAHGSLLAFRHFSDTSIRRWTYARSRLRGTLGRGYRRVNQRTGDTRRANAECRTSDTLRSRPPRSAWFSASWHR